MADYDGNTIESTHNLNRPLLELLSCRESGKNGRGMRIRSRPTLADRAR